MKPIDLITRSLENSSKQGAVVLDLFNGSGSTGVACIKTWRNFCGIELDPKYVDVAMIRWTTFMKENQIEYTITRNGQPFEMPVYSPDTGESPHKNN